MIAQDLADSHNNSDKNFFSELQKKCSNKRTLLSLCILLAIVAAGFILRLVQLDSRGFFGDEIYSVLVANGKGDPELIAFDSIRPIYFLLLRFWMLFGSSEYWLRLPSVIFGTANIVLTYYLGSLAAGRKVGLVASLLMAFSPMEIHYSQLARMYTLGSFLALSGSILLLHAWQTGKKLFLISWALMRATMVLTLPLTVVLLAVDILLSLWKERKNKLLPLGGICFAGIVAAYLCFAWKMPQITAHSEYDSWRYGLPVPQIFDAAMMFVNFTSTALPLQESEGPWLGGFFSEAYSVMILALLGLAIRPALRLRWLIWCLGWSVFPIAIAFVASQFTASFVITRYLMFAAPFTLIAIAAGWTTLWSQAKLRAVAVAGVILYLAIIVLNLGYFYSNPVHEDWREISKFIQGREKTGDNVVVWNYHSSYLFNYYYTGKNKTYDLIVNCKPDKIDMPPKVTIELPGLNKVSGRTWFVVREAPEGWLSAWTIYKLLLQHLDKNYRILERDRCARTDVYLLTEK